MFNNLKRLIKKTHLVPILWFIAALLFAVALLSYSVTDSSLNLSSNISNNNLLGWPGAIIADLALQSFGAVSLILSLVIIVLASQAIIGYRISWFWLRLVSVVFSLIFIAASLGDVQHRLLPTYIGGSLGHLLLMQVQPYDIYLDYINVKIILPAPGLICLFFSLNIRLKKYIDVCQVIGQFIYKYAGISWMLDKLAELSYRVNFGKPYEPVVEYSFVMKNGKKQRVIKKKKSPRAIDRQVLPQPKGDLIMPNAELLDEEDQRKQVLQNKAELERNAADLQQVMEDFGIKGKMLDIRQGPVVTMYEFEPAAGTKSSRVIGLADDIARSLSALSTRISVIPGKNALGIELPNKDRMFFKLRQLLEHDEFSDKKALLPLVLGKDLTGRTLVADLAKMPHLLVAGTTGAGKSVAINAMILSLLYRYSPDDCRMILIDPKMLELSVYDNIPHLMTPVVTEPSKAIIALKWAVKEMENRYRLMSQLGVRNIAGYNQEVASAMQDGRKLGRQVQTGFDSATGKPIMEDLGIELKKMPFIVIIVDEMADLMIVAGKEIEASIQRLAQMARAAGIHIIMATQRPSVDVITGVIKANFPSRISFRVTSKIDSRTILGEQGAEQLLGMGDMLFMGNSSSIKRVHGPFVDDKEVERVCNYLRQLGKPEYVSAVTEDNEEETNLTDEGAIAADASGEDSLYQKALKIVKTERKSSISYIQRSLRIGYNKAANLVDQMEKEGVLSSPGHTGKREILIPE